MDNKKKVLLIDDDQGFFFFVKNTLEITGEYEVFISVDSKEGIDLAVSLKPDLILLDRIIPKIPGSKVADILLTTAETKDIPLIFLTSVVSKEQIGNSSIAKIDGHYFIPKDVGVKSLIDNIKNFLAENPPCKQ